MSNILDKIVAHKKVEVATAKREISYRKLENSSLFGKTTYSMTGFVRNSSKSGIIAEFKRKSPSKGIINDTASVEEVAQGYEQAGVSGMSVLTDNEFFGGTTEDLIAARKMHDIPLLRKDFMIDEYQIVEAKAMGADIILLIAACLSPIQIKHLGAFAHSLNMEVLLEVHNEEELNTSINEYVNLLGVNNRDLKRFKTDIQVSKDLADKIPDDFVKVSESGIDDIDKIIELKTYGYEGFLIGENFMKTPNPGVAAKSFIRELNQRKVI